MRLYWPLELRPAFDALTSDRAYRQLVPGTQALATLEEELGRGLWDPRAFAGLAALVRGAQ